jgi:transposase
VDGKPGRPRKVNDAELVAMYMQGITGYQIARKLGISERTIYSALQRNISPSKVRRLKNEATRASEHRAKRIAGPSNQEPRTENLPGQPAQQGTDS